MLQPCEANTASVIFIRHEISVGILFHGARAPFRTVRVRSGMHEVRVHDQPGPEAGARRARAVR